MQSSARHQTGAVVADCRSTATSDYSFRSRSILTRGLRSTLGTPRLTERTIPIGDPDCRNYKTFARALLFKSQGRARWLTKREAPLECTR